MTIVDCSHISSFVHKVQGMFCCWFRLSFLEKLLLLNQYVFMVNIWWGNLLPSYIAVSHQNLEDMCLEGLPQSK